MMATLIFNCFDDMDDAEANGKLLIVASAAVGIIRQIVVSINSFGMR